MKRLGRFPVSVERLSRHDNGQKSQKSSPLRFFIAIADRHLPTCGVLCRKKCKVKRQGWLLENSSDLALRLTSSATCRGTGC